MLDTFGGVTFFYSRPNDWATRTFGFHVLRKLCLSDCNSSVVSCRIKKFHKTKVAQHEKVNFWVAFSKWYSHRFQFRRIYASSNEVQKSPRDTIFNSRQLLVNEFLGRTTGSKSDGNGRKYAETKWSFDYGSNDSEWPREFRNHFSFELRWKFNFCTLLTRDRKILKIWKWKHSGIQLRPEIHLKIEILKSWRSKWKFRMTCDFEFWLLN